MTATAAMILSNNGGKRSTLPLDRATSDALAEFVKLQWPRHTRKHVERAYDLSPEAAKTVVEANASKATLDRIWKHRNGGWRVLLPVMGAVVGQTADAFIIEERKRLARERDEYDAQSARLAAMGRDLLVVVGVGARRAGGISASGRGEGPDHPGDLPDRPRRSTSRA